MAIKRGLLLNVAHNLCQKNFSVLEDIDDTLSESS